MVRKKQRRRSNRVEEDPMAGTANLVDAMLVIAVGFLVFVIISWNMQAIVFNEDMTPEQKQQVMQSIKSVSEVLVKVILKWVKYTRIHRQVS